jgi:hypothetical protein
MRKFKITALSLGLLIMTTARISNGAELAPKDVDLSLESQIAAPDVTAVSNFTSAASTRYSKRRAEAQLPAVPMHTTNAKSGVQTPPEEMTSVFVPVLSIVSGEAPADGAWQAFVKQWLDMSKPGYLGNLLSDSQQKDIMALDAERQQLDNRLANATAHGALAQPLQEQLRTESVSIAALESTLIKSDALTYEQATDILFRLNMLKASLDAASHGRAKPLLSDYFNDKDPISYRDHLLRKLYYFRLNGLLSDGEYDELRAHVNHASERLATVGQQLDRDAILDRFKQLDADISKMADDSPTAGDAQHLGKKI